MINLYFYLLIWNWCQGKVTALKSLSEYVLLRIIKLMPIKNLSLIWMGKRFILNKLTIMNLYSHKNNLDSIDVIGHLMSLKEPESPINKFLKTLVKKCFKTFIMDITPQYSLTDKQGQESLVQLRVSQVLNRKDCFKCVFKMYSEEKNKTNLKISLRPSESLTWKFIMKNSRISFLKIPKIIKCKWKHWLRHKLNIMPKVLMEKHPLN